jgi:cysteine synthase A
MAELYTDITKTIGNTPLVKLNKITSGLKANIFVKCEFFNPLASVKDRVAFAMIEAAEKGGLIDADTEIIEPTSGNTGIGLAFICAQKGYKLTIVMPDTMSVERQKLIKSFGAKLVLTEGKLGMAGAIAKAEELRSQSNKSFIPNQFTNKANFTAHYNTTGPEIWAALNGKVDCFTAGVGTGGTISGAGLYLKEKNADVKIIAVEPDTSPVLSGGQAAPHKIQGIGAGFVPEILRRDVIDEILTVSAEHAGEFARDLAQKEGIFAGISAGAAVCAAITLARSGKFDGKNIVTVLPDTGERYLSTWLWDF